MLNLVIQCTPFCNHTYGIAIKAADLRTLLAYPLTEEHGIALLVDNQEAICVAHFKQLLKGENPVTATST